MLLYYQPFSIIIKDHNTTENTHTGVGICKLL